MAVQEGRAPPHARAGDGARWLPRAAAAQRQQDGGARSAVRAAAPREGAPSVVGGGLFWAVLPRVRQVVAMSSAQFQCRPKDHLASMHGEMHARCKV